MSFVQSINPFDNIICAPYWSIWILIIISWAMSVSEILCISLLQRYQQRSDCNLKEEVTTYVRLKIINHLKSIIINGQSLPSEITSEIMSMLPAQFENWQTTKYALHRLKMRKRKKCTICIVNSTYATFRFCSNICNFIIILSRYVTWYNEHLEVSNWRRYCALIVAFLYLPMFKGRALMRLFNFSLIYDYKVREMDNIWMKIQTYLFRFDLLFDLFFGAFLFPFITFPFTITGSFVFFPTVFMSVAIAAIIWTFVYCCTQCLISMLNARNYAGRAHEQAMVIGAVLIATFEAHWAYILSLLTMMELYAGTGWIESYVIGISGSYCKEDDYFQMSKWSDYPMDIQFLVFVDIRKSWKVNSFCSVYSRSDSKWYDGQIEAIQSEESKENGQNEEWLIVRYKNNKKTKRIQRFCSAIRPISEDHILSLKKGSLCLIYSRIINLWCEGKVISIFEDDEGEWLRIKYYDTNEYKLCEIQRYSDDLKIFQRTLLWKPNFDIPKPSKPWTLLETNNQILPEKLSNVVQLNEFEYIVAGYSYDDTIDHEFEPDADEDEFESEQNGIYKFNTIQNQWSLFIAYPKSFYSQYHNLCIDYDEKIIYLFSGSGSGIGSGIWKIKIDKKEFVHCSLENEISSFGGMAFVIDSEVNIFWGANNNKHLLWNQSTKEMDVLHDFDHLKKGILSYGMVHNVQKGYFLFFGGYLGQGLGRTDEIWKCEMSDFNNKKWSKLDVTMPDKMQSFGCVINSEMSHVVVFGGSDSKGLSSKIYVLTLETMEWRLSKIHCPFRGVGFGNVILSTINGVEYVHLLQGMYSHISAPLADILAY